MEATSEGRSFFQSPRNQRRLLVAALIVLAAGVAVFTFAVFRNTGDTTPETFSNEPADIYKPQKTVAVEPSAREVAGKFIKTAVARKNLAASYDLVAPELRQGLTRKQWETGNIPVVYYESDKLELVTFKVERSYENELVWQVYMVPKPGSGQQPTVFFLGLKRANKNAPWKVFEWVPNYRPAVPDPGG